METDTPQKNSFKKIKKLFIINDILLLPCVYLTFANILIKIFDADVNVWTRSFLGLTLPIVFLRIFFVPYIASIILSILYFINLKKKNFPKKEVVSFIVLFLICIVGLISVEPVFYAAMGV